MRMLCACPVLGIPSSPMTSVPCELRKAWNDENQWPLWSLLAMLCDSDTWAILHTEAPFSLAERRLCRRIEESWAEPFSNVSFSFSSFQAYNFHLQTTQKACGFWCSAWSKLFLKSNFWFSLVNTQNGHKKEPFCTKGEQLHNCTIAVQCWSVICTNWRGEQAEHTADFQVAVVLWHQSQHRESLIFVLFELNHIPHFSMCARHSAEWDCMLQRTTNCLVILSVTHGREWNTHPLSTRIGLVKTSFFVAAMLHLVCHIMFNWHKQLKCNDVGCMHMHSCERCHSCHDSQLQKKPLKTCICVKGCKQHHVNDTIWKTMFFFCSWFDESFWVLSHMMTLTVLDNFQWTCCNRVVPSRGCWSRDMWSSDFWRTPPCVKFWSTSHRFC